MLEDENAGPLTRVRGGHAATKGPGVVQETYKTALRAYISSLSSAADSGAVIDKAKQVMNELDAAMGDTPEGKQRLINVYIGKEVITFNYFFNISFFLPFTESATVKITVSGSDIRNGKYREIPQEIFKRYKVHYISHSC